MKQTPNNDSKGKSASNDRSQGTRDIGVLAVLAVLAMLTKNSGAFGSNDNISSKITNTTEITRETDDFAGKSVTIRSKPVERIGVRSFTVTDRRLLGGKPIVVVNASGVPFDLPKDRNTEVQVTGQVRKLDIPKIERDFKLNIQDEYYKDYINQPAIIARDITLAPKPGQVATNPEQYYNKRVAIMGKVRDVHSPTLVNLNEGGLISGKDLPIVLSQKPKVAINEGQTVVVMGKVRSFVATDTERNNKMNLNSDVKRKLQTEYGDTPILVADSIFP